MRRLSTLYRMLSTIQFAQGVSVALAASSILVTRCATVAANHDGNDHHHPNGGFCTQTAQAALKACRHSANDDFWIAIGNCDNVPDVTDRQVCKQDAGSALRVARTECGSQFDARKEVCAALGQDPYDPVINPENFVEGITNSYFPLTPGTTFVYQGHNQEITVAVTHEVKEILGVKCVVVRDTVSEHGQVVEDTEDWYAQDKDGNVWYFGELSKGYVDGELATLEGSWKGGRDNAKPGIVMKAAPLVGNVYRQEFSLGVAEDMGEVMSLTRSANVPGASCTHTCLVTKDFSPLEPTVVENKLYAPGIGFILGIDTETGERVELVHFGSD